MIMQHRSHSFIINDCTKRVSFIQYYFNRESYILLCVKDPNFSILSYMEKHLPNGVTS
ncbi:protein of unknown function [Petrocella atlantisensis]|uniref:Uncharacterized protein n=1 Tax=Petrocella atlantisensis TaxID=2173034 RepID=A0A3P7NTJ9_9FIRM|nr:protein of unknown function [Petrocella atlantisensis]